MSRSLPCVLLISSLVAAGCGPTQTQTQEAGQPETSSAATAAADLPEAPPSATPAESAAPATASAKASAEPPKAATKVFPLAEYKLPLSIELAETAKLEKNESKDKLGGVNIDGAVGSFGVRVFAAPGDMTTAAGIKAKLTKMLRPAEKFLKEEADLLVYERKGGGVEFVAKVTVAGKAYLCQARDEADAAEKLEPVIAACKTLKKAP